MDVRHSGGEMEIEKRHVEIESVPIHYQVIGSGAPVVLVHGLSGSARWWARNIGPLAQHFRVYVIDLIGFGASHGRHPFVLSDAAGLLARWMDRLELEAVRIVGHSMGGYISAELAADFPNRIDRLVLVDAAGLPFHHNYLRHGFNLMKALRHMPFDFLPVLIQDSIRAGPITLLSAIRQVLASDLEQKLAHIEVPTLVVWGKYDTVLPVEIGRDLATALPNGYFVVVKRAGHNPMWDRADAFNRMVLRFLLSEQE